SSLHSANARASVTRDRIYARPFCVRIRFRPVRLPAGLLWVTPDRHFAFTVSILCSLKFLVGTRPIPAAIVRVFQPNLISLVMDGLILLIFFNASHSTITRAPSSNERRCEFVSIV